MRFYNILAILALGGASAQVADDEARNLRGPEPGDEVEIEGRDLLVVGGSASSSSYSKSKSLYIRKCWHGDGCADVYGTCYEIAYANAVSGAYTGSGASDAEARFFAHSCCRAMAEASACTFACVKAKADIDLKANVDATSAFGTNMVYELSANLKTATLTIAKAASSAAAQTQASVYGEVSALTDADYCSGPGKGHYLCDPSVAIALAEAGAASTGDASALAAAGAGSGTLTWVGGCVTAYGSSIDKIKGLFTSVAKSFSFASVYTAAMAKVYAGAFADATAISVSCGKAYDDYCGCPTCGGKCKWASKEEACSFAIANASGFAGACADACAAASASAYAQAMVSVTFGGTLTNCKNDGKPMGITWVDGQEYGKVSCAMVCPRY